MREQSAELQAQAENSKQEMLLGHHVETSKGLVAKQNALVEAERHRAVREEALAKQKSNEGEKFTASIHAKKERDKFE